MTDLFPDAPVSIEAQIAAVEREISMRRRVYPDWVSAHRMTQKKADAEIRAMEAVLQTLLSHRAKAA